MVKGKCTVKGCDFRVEDAPHVDGVLDELRGHFRAVHPSKWFRAVDVGSRIEAYNLTWEEVMVIYFGEGQEGYMPDRYIANEIANANSQYNEEVQAKAQQIVEEYANARRAVPQAGAVNADGAGGNARARRRFNRGVGQAVPPVEWHAPAFAGPDLRFDNIVEEE